MRSITALSMLVVAACGTTHATELRPPRLVVLVVIDQLPEWAFAEKLPHLDGGLARAVAAGRRYTGEYPSAATVTAAGHATLGTGASPRDTGIISNDWYRRDLGQELPAVEDAAGGWTTGELRAPGVADALAAAHPTAHAVAVSLKPRASLLPLGQRAGVAVWYDSARVGWSTNGARPAWVDRLEAEHPVAPRLGYVWEPRDAVALARETGEPDAAPGELGTHGLGATFPHRLADTDAPAKAVVATPLGHDLVLEAALAALAGEHLGEDEVPDYLSVSFSAHDYVGHAWGHESWEAWDTVHRLDASIGQLIDALDHKLGRGGWVMVLTSDHGAAPLPERHGASRHAYGEIERAAEAAAAGVAGAGDWIATVRYPTLYLGRAADALPAATRGAVIDAIVAALRGLGWLGRVDRRDRLTGDCAAMTATDARLCWALDPERSGEVVFTPAPGVVLHEDDEATATHHGSLEPYDFQVPLVVIAPGLPPGRVAAPVSMLRVAPTLARWLGVPPPRRATAPPL